ncbi:MAG TPA: hypothetical protein IAB96_04010 [Candidatus Coprenecus pullicola]|nr:hypothetical protein [Candidatus Coprenecus pullicola]
MEKKNWHICTEGLEDDLIFKSAGDFVYGMNGVPVCALTSGVSILCFCLMDNHVHFIVNGTEADGERFIRQYLRRLSRLVRIPVEKASMKLIDDDEYLRQAVGYVLRNPVKAYNVMPAAYPWGSGALYFDDGSRHKHYEIVGEIGVVKMRKLLCSRVRLPDDYKVSPDGMVCPECYVDISAVEELYNNRPARMIYYLSVNKDMEMELSGDMLHKAKYRDADLLGTVSDICRESFSKNGPADLRLEDRYRLADILRRRYGLGIKQLARLTGTKTALLKIVLK